MNNMSGNIMNYMYLQNAQVEPAWMKDERYDYCEDFRTLAAKGDTKKKGHKLPAILAFIASIF